MEIPKNEIPNSKKKYGIPQLPEFPRYPSLKQYLIPYQ
jgi:hypothetical protein